MEPMEPVKLYDADGNLLKFPIATRRRHGLILLIGFFTTVLAWGVMTAVEKAASSRPQVPTTVGTVSGRNLLFVNPNDYGKDAVDLSSWRGPLRGAVRSWENALGRKIAMPELSGNHAPCITAIACSDLETYTIHIAPPYDESRDKFTIMLHEVGHLLGVPHIEDDLLMDGVYRGSVRVYEPTPMAVEIANLRYRGVK